MFDLSISFFDNKKKYAVELPQRMENNVLFFCNTKKIFAISTRSTAEICDISRHFRATGRAFFFWIILRNGTFYFHFTTVGT